MAKIIVVGDHRETDRAYLEFVRTGQDVVFVKSIEELKDAMQGTGEVIISPPKQEQTFPITLRPVDIIPYEDYQDGKAKRRDRRAKQRKNQSN
jgi:hypothetical protein